MDLMIDIPIDFPGLADARHLRKPVLCVDREVLPTKGIPLYSYEHTKNELIEGNKMVISLV
jgi:hypothetical protein